MRLGELLGGLRAAASPRAAVAEAGGGRQTCRSPVPLRGGQSPGEAPSEALA
jgi:hypothetical protein